jgi:hypothetical protein
MVSWTIEESEPVIAIEEPTKSADGGRVRDRQATLDLIYDALREAIEPP